MKQLRGTMLGESPLGVKKRILANRGTKTKTNGGKNIVIHILISIYNIHIIVLTDIVSIEFEIESGIL